MYYHECPMGGSVYPSVNQNITLLGKATFDGPLPIEQPVLIGPSSTV